MMKSTRTLLAWTSATLILGLLGLQLVAKLDSPSRSFQFLSLYARVLHLAREHYVDPVEPAKLEARAAAGLLAGLNGESGLLEAGWTPENRHPYGLLLRSGGTYPVVLAVAPDSPAEKAGFSTGDVIRRIAGKTIYGQQLPAIRAQLVAAGQAGLPIELLRSKDEEKKELKLTGVPEFAWLGAAMAADSAAGPARLQLFNTRADDARAALALIRTQRAQTPARKIILDLRRNAGDDYAGAAQLAGALGGKPFTVAGNPGRPDGSPLPLAFPAAVLRIDAVLTDGSTTRAAEALAASLKAAGIPVYGRVTPGQATVESLIALTDGRRLWLSTRVARLANAPLAPLGLDPDFAAPAEVEDLAAFTREKLAAAASLPGTPPGSAS